VSNVFLLDGPRGDRWLIDTGHWSERATLLWELRRTGLRPGELTGVLLTHRHSDHAGNAAFLQRRYGAKIYAHRDDAAVLEGRVARPRLRPEPGATRLARLFAQVENLLPACKNIGVTHITNGCYRLHPVEWNIGEAAGMIAAHSIATRIPPRKIRSDKALLAEFQSKLQTQGFELAWPRVGPV